MTGEVISAIFARKKKDGHYRLILNLKEFNKLVSYQHFKMDTLHTIANLMTQNCFMASVDLKDAYYSIRIHKTYRKYLKFIWEGKLYQFTCTPNVLYIMLSTAVYKNSETTSLYSSQTRSYLLQLHR